MVRHRHVLCRSGPGGEKGGVGSIEPIPLDVLHTHCIPFAKHMSTRGEWRRQPSSLTEINAGVIPWYPWATDLGRP